MDALSCILYRQSSAKKIGRRMVIKLGYRHFVIFNWQFDAIWGMTPLLDTPYHVPSKRSEVDLLAVGLVTLWGEDGLYCEKECIGL